MLEEITALFTQDNITFALALFGALGNVIALCWSRYNARQKFDVETIHFHAGEKGILCYLMILNRSTNQLTITDLSIEINGVHYPAIKIPKVVHQCIKRSGKEITDVQNNYSHAFPIVLAGKFATSGYFYFPFPQETAVPSSNTFSLKVCTSKGKAVQKKLSRNVHPL